MVPLRGIRRAGLIATAWLASTIARAALPGIPVEKWRHNTPRDTPSCTPIVVQMTDDAADGDVDADDVPVVPYLTSVQLLTVLDGRDGSAHFSVPQPTSVEILSLAAGNLDADPLIEIVG